MRSPLATSGDSVSATSANPCKLVSGMGKTADDKEGCSESLACLSPLIGASIFCLPLLTIPALKTDGQGFIVILPLLAVSALLVFFGFLPAINAVLRRQEPSSTDLIATCSALLSALGMFVALAI